MIMLPSYSQNTAALHPIAVDRTYFLPQQKTMSLLNSQKFIFAEFINPNFKSILPHTPSKNKKSLLTKNITNVIIISNY